MARVFGGVSAGLVAACFANQLVAQEARAPAERAARRVTVVRRAPTQGQAALLRHALLLPDDDEPLTGGTGATTAPQSPGATGTAADAARRAARELPRETLDDGGSESWQRARPYGPHWVDSAWASGYWAGRLDERRFQSRRFNLDDMAARRERLYGAHGAAMSSGLAMLRAGEYSRAVIALTMAAELDQGDPAARVHLAQARLALGQYSQAGRTLRRAYQLQPKLVYVDLRLDDSLPSGDEFARHVDRLAAASDRDADASFLLGAMEFQRGRYDAAWRAFRKVRPRDDATRAFLEITRPAVESAAVDAAARVRR